MTFDPKRSQQWTIEDIRRAEAQNRRQRYTMALIAILIMMGLVGGFMCFLVWG